jgi:hypothetical protein
MHARNLQRRRGVDGPNAPMGDAAAENDGMEQAIGIEIVQVFLMPPPSHVPHGGGFL